MHGDEAFLLCVVGKWPGVNLASRIELGLPGAEASNSVMRQPCNSNAEIQVNYREQFGVVLVPQHAARRAHGPNQNGGLLLVAIRLVPRLFNYCLGQLDCFVVVASRLQRKIPVGLGQSEIKLSDAEATTRHARR